MIKPFWKVIWLSKAYIYTHDRKIQLPGSYHKEMMGQHANIQEGQMLTEVLLINTEKLKTI